MKRGDYTSWSRPPETEHRGRFLFSLHRRKGEIKNPLGFCLQACAASGVILSAASAAKEPKSTTQSVHSRILHSLPSHYQCYLVG